ncbi:MAG: serine/threonine-protein phosphatase [Planctomycetes bacterium]|nr:serine/threonine-protein phosphatase [Planctomycetota bacterium]
MSAFEPVRYAALTDVGVKRSHNQDACAANPAVDAAGFSAHGHVFVVADGMGGHAVGEKASAKAVRDIPLLYSKHARDGVIPAIRRAFQETNTGIYQIGAQNPEFRGLGTTSTALVIRPEGAWVGHVGDSRAYRIRAGKAEQLTFDHSWVWEIAKRQGVDPDELGDFKKNVIIRSLGPDPDVEVDIEGPHPVQPGDAFLLCSDGLTGVVNPQEVGAVVSALPPEEAVRFLVNLANLRGGPDNITVLIVQVPDGNAAGGRSPGGGANPLKKLWAAWTKRVPVPFTLLGGGCVLAILSLLMQQSEVPGAVVLFVLAALLILGGLVGLIVHLQKEEPPSVEVPADDTPRELKVYKTHDCVPGAELVERFSQMEASLLEGMRNQGVPADYDAHARLAATADEAATKPDVVAAFRARCASLFYLAEAFHKSRHKQESFRPSWTPSPSSPS